MTKRHKGESRIAFKDRRKKSNARRRESEKAWRKMMNETYGETEEVEKDV